jgi:hypothetical protein
MKNKEEIINLLRDLRDESERYSDPYNHGEIYKTVAAALAQILNVGFCTACEGIGAHSKTCWCAKDDLE